MNKFTINGVTYIAHPFGFNTICELEEMGVSIETANDKPMSMIRAYFGICSGLDKENAGKQMELHLINGGNFDDITEAMSKEMEVSDFFRLSTRQRKRKLQRELQRRKQSRSKLKR